MEQRSLSPAQTALICSQPLPVSGIAEISVFINAQIFTNSDGMALETFVIWRPNGFPLVANRHEMIQLLLQRLLSTWDLPLSRARRLSNKLSHFQVTAKITSLSANTVHRTYVELTTLDQPGLLALVGEVFTDLGLFLHSAHISTIGEQVKELLILTKGKKRFLSAKMQHQLQEKLTEALNPIDKI